MDIKFYHLLLFNFLLLTIIQKAESQTRNTDAHPGVRNGHAMVCHASLDGILMFGGADEKQVRGDTWLWSSERWKKLSEKGPTPRTFGAMVYRDKTDEVILFGGNKVLFGGEDKTDVLLNDTWVWRRGDWVRIKTKESPEPRSEASMVYDAKNDLIILFGGFKFTDNGKSLIRLGDTWQFDGQEWTKMTSVGHSARSGSAITFDQKFNRIILFGGNFASKPEEKLSYNGSTWSYSKNRWNNMPTETANVYNSSMTYDKANEHIVRFGGWTGSERISETWVFKDSDWRKHDLNAFPEPRNHTVISFDPSSKLVTLFGGHNGEEVFGDVWILEKQGWKKIQDYPKRKRVENNH